MKLELPLVLALVIGPVAASAQVAPGAPGTSQTIPEKDRSRPQDMPRRQGPDGSSQVDGLSTGRSLSDELEKKGGVIEPPSGIDPEIVEPPPAAGAPMPVIPPPGTPGGSPGPEPK